MPAGADSSRVRRKDFAASARVSRRRKAGIETGHALALHSDPAQGYDSLDACAKFRRRSTVFKEGTPATALYEILEGTIVVCKRLADGRRQITEILGPGSWVGLASGDTHSYSAETLTAAKLRRHSRRDIQGSAGFQSRISVQILQELETMHNHALLLGRKSALERIASFLLCLPALSRVFARGKTLHGGDTFAISMKQKDIGDYLGLKVETVSRQIAALRRRMIIATGKPGHFRLLDIEALRQLANLGETAAPGLVLLTSGASR